MSLERTLPSRDRSEQAGQRQDQALPSGPAPSRKEGVTAAPGPVLTCAGLRQPPVGEELTPAGLWRGGAPLDHAHVVVHGGLRGGGGGGGQPSPGFQSPHGVGKAPTEAARSPRGRGRSHVSLRILRDAGNAATRLSAQTGGPEPLLKVLARDSERPCHRASDALAA